MTLEVCAFSPSDTKHHFKDFRLESTYPYVSREDLPRGRGIFAAYKANRAARNDRLKDKKHGWLNGSHLRRPNLGSRKRLLGTSSLAFDFSEFTLRRGWTERVLPKVPLVTNFLIRRQYYRIISTSAVQKILTESLTHIQSWRWERWRDLDPGHYRSFKKGLSYCSTRSMFQVNAIWLDLNFYLKNKLPHSLKHLAIYLDATTTMHGEGLTRASPLLGHRLAWISHLRIEFQVIAVSFVVDAGDFFDRFGFLNDNGAIPAPDDVAYWRSVDESYSKIQWRSLKRLALTSRALRQGNKAEINRLLGVVARVVLHCMPQIEVIELWNSEIGSSSSFFFDAGRHGQAEISWRGTWDYSGATLSPETVYAWNLVARQRTADREAIVTTFQMPQVVPQKRDYLAPLNRLRLWRDVFHPISQCQLRWESRNQNVG